MHTYLPADSTIKGCLRDYLRRLELGDDTDECRSRLSEITWVPLGASGRSLLRRLTEVLPEKSQNYLPQSELYTLTAIYKRETKLVYFAGYPDISLNNFESLPTVARQRLKNRRVVVLDSSIHSGISMRMVCQLVQAFDPQWVSTYTLCLKSGARFIPNYFSLLIHDWDRSLFWLDHIPVNRLAKNVHDKNIQLRSLESGDDVADLDRKNIANDGLEICIDFENGSSNSLHNYVCSWKNEICGHLLFQWVGNKNTGIGCRIRKIKIVQSTDINLLLLLLRWSETCARQQCCRFIELRCIEPTIYRRFVNLGFKPVGDSGSGVLRHEILHLTKTFTAFPDDDAPGHIFHQF
jgi:hypothetical protein